MTMRQFYDWQMAGGGWILPPVAAPTLKFGVSRNGGIYFSKKINE
jgi:hypothetical protein